MRAPVHGRLHSGRWQSEIACCPWEARHCGGLRNVTPLVSGLACCLGASRWLPRCFALARTLGGLSGGVCGFSAHAGLAASGLCLGFALGTPTVGVLPRKVGRQGSVALRAALKLRSVVVASGLAPAVFCVCASTPGCPDRRGRFKQVHGKDCGSCLQVNHTHRAMTSGERVTTRATRECRGFDSSVTHVVPVFQLASHTGGVLGRGACGRLFLEVTLGLHLKVSDGHSAVLRIGKRCLLNSGHTAIGRSRQRGADKSPRLRIVYF